MSKSLPCDGAEKPSYPRFVASNKSWSKNDSPVVRVHLSLDKPPKSLWQLLPKETHGCHTCDQAPRGDQSSELTSDKKSPGRSQVLHSSATLIKPASCSLSFTSSAKRSRYVLHTEQHVDSFSVFSGSTSQLVTVNAFCTRPCPQTNNNRLQIRFLLQLVF